MDTTDSEDEEEEHGGLPIELRGGASHYTGGARVEAGGQDTAGHS